MTDMKIVIVAKRNIIVSTANGDVQIAKGDKFTLYGKVFAYKTTLIDVEKIAHAFDIVREPGIPAVQTYEFTHGLSLLGTRGPVIFKAGQQIKTASDIVYVNGAVLDIAKHMNAIKVVIEVPNIESDAEPGTEGAGEGTGTEGAGEGTGTECAGEGTGTECAGEGTGTEGAGEGTGTEGAGEGTGTEGAGEGTGTEGAGEGDDNTESIEPEQTEMFAGEDNPGSGVEGVVLP